MSNRVQRPKPNNSANSNLFLGLIVLAFIIYKTLPSYLFVSRPQASFIAATSPDTSKPPIQKDLAEDQIDEHSINDIFIAGTPIKIGPVATYEISARVVSKKNYTQGWDAELMPVDLALVWGELAKDKHHKFMTYRHSKRYISWRLSMESELNEKYVISHSANVHFVPSNKTIKNALISTKVDERVRVTGYLVNIQGPEGDLRRTSLSRQDVGDGACENLYVTKLQIGDQVFE